MPSCDYSCAVQCVCECIELDVCICGHREHYNYCPVKCCVLVKCRNHKYCKAIIPKWVSGCRNGLCLDCFIQMGEHTITYKKGHCCVCLERVFLLELKCNHKVCNDCWYNITNKVYNNISCPIYRNPN